MLTAFSRDHAYAEALDIISSCRLETTDERGWNVLMGASAYLLKQWREHQHQASQTHTDIQRQKQIWECND